MSKKIIKTLIISALLLLLSSLNAAALDFSIDTGIPVDSAIEKGVFPNGLTYYIRENKKPENRIYIRLVVNTGSVMEDDDQQGLAHFLEHMAFNGTENFPGNSLVDFLEKEGVRFGPDLNAFTGFDKTVYMLELPADKPDTVELGFQVLSDWASGILNTAEEIDKERGVVIEEWRKNKGAEERISDASIQTIFKDSRYAERIPIGKVEILENFDKKTLDRYYSDWYRPDLMAVIAVGDFNSTEMKEKITRHFGKFPLRKFRRKRVIYDIPDRKGSDYLIISDKEAVNAKIRIIYLHDKFGEQTKHDYRESIKRGFFSIMLNNRYDEIKQQKEPPFLDGGGGFGSVALTKSAFSIFCTPDEKDILKGFDVVTGETARIMQHGFTESEFERAKIRYYKMMENSTREKENAYSSAYTEEYTRNFIENEYIPGIEFEFELYKKLEPAITLKEVNSLVEYYMGEDNRVVILSAPEKEGVIIPSREELENRLKTVFEKDYEPYVDDVNGSPLVDESELPQAGKVISEIYDEKFGIYRYTLSNGAEILIKETDFRENEVLMTAVSKGGHSKASDEDWASANLAALIVTRAGVGDFSKIQLDKMLEGKIVSVTPFVEELTEGFTGKGSVEDLELMFKLLYLYFTSPRKDSESYDSYISRLKIYLANQDVKPDVAFAKTLRRILTNGHFRGRPFDLDFINEVELERGYSVYKERFSDPGDFTFIFTGSAPRDRILDLALKYIAPLENSTDFTIGERESWSNTGMDIPDGVIREDVFRGVDEKSEVAVIFKGSYKWDRYENLVIATLAEAVDMRLREVIREGEGGSYNISVYPSLKQFPDSEYQLIVFFGCSPDRAENLKKIVFEEIEKMKKDIPEDILLKIKNANYQQHDKNILENRFWDNVILESELSSSKLEWIDMFKEMVGNISTAQLERAAVKYFDTGSFIDVTLYPESYKDKITDQ
jgi:zinc protease